MMAFGKFWVDFEVSHVNSKYVHDLISNMFIQNNFEYKVPQTIPKK